MPTFFSKARSLYKSAKRSLLSRSTRSSAPDHVPIASYSLYERPPGPASPPGPAPLQRPDTLELFSPSETELEPRHDTTPSPPNRTQLPPQPPNRAKRASTLYNHTQRSPENKVLVVFRLYINIVSEID